MLGKVRKDFLEDVVLKNLGAKSKDVIVGPGLGLDNAVIGIDRKRVLIVTSDPLSFIPSIGTRNSAFLTISLLASDYTTSGNMPEFAFFTFNLPPELDDSVLSEYFKALGRECKRLGINIAGGHTGRYPGCNPTIVGGGVLMGRAENDGYVVPSMAAEGDRIIITKGAAIATTAVLAYSFPETVEEKLGNDVLKAARAMLKDCSTVEDAIAASSTGLREKVTSMHDATEGGVLGGLHELSVACGRAVFVDKEKIFVRDETRDVCNLFSLDPLTSLSEGTLIITCRDEYTDEVVRSVERKGISTYIIGRVGKGKGLWISERGETYKPYLPPNEDPYWYAYSTAIKRGWK